MINLIPNEEKKKKLKDFYFRLTVISFAMLGMTFTIAAISILPAYFLSVVEKQTISTKIETQKKEEIPLPDQEILALSKDLNNKLNLIEKTKTDKYLVSEKIINAIILEKMPDIKITKISYSNDVAKGKTVSVDGIAPSRERLLLLSKKLEGDSLFTKVDLPISNFVKGSNIAFHLNLMPI